jgi:hypothetical protein
MTTASIDTEAIKKGVDLRDLAGRLVELRKESTAEYSGPCPRCGGDDRFHVKADMFFCRQCYPLENGRPHDAIEFVQWAGIVADFPAACAYLGGAALIPPPAAPRRAPTPKPPATGWRDPAWQREARAILARGRATLEDPLTPEGRAYLAARGLTPETWRAWGLGYTPRAWDPVLKSERPAVVIPWQREKVTALKYRFLTVPAGGLRYSSKAGGSCLAFGLGLAGAHFQTLWLIEGELNTLALWQALRAAGCVNCDVASFGSENKAAHLDPVVKGWAGRYRQVIIWTDDPAKAAAAMAALPGAFGLRSPVVDGAKLDANELLKLGGLAAFAIAAWERFDADPAFSARLRAEIATAPVLAGG